MIDVGTTGMGAGMPGGLGAKIRHAHPARDRRAGGRFSRSQDHRRASRLALGRRDDRGRAAQGQRLLGDVGLGAEIFPGAAQDRHPLAAPGQGDVRQRLSEHSLRPPVQGMGASSAMPTPSWRRSFTATPSGSSACDEPAHRACDAGLCHRPLSRPAARAFPRDRDQRRQSSRQDRSLYRPHRYPPDLRRDDGGRGVPKGQEPQMGAGARHRRRPRRGFPFARPGCPHQQRPRHARAAGGGSRARLHAGAGAPVAALGQGAGPP